MFFAGVARIAAGSERGAQIGVDRTVEPLRSIPTKSPDLGGFTRRLFLAQIREAGAGVLRSSAGGHRSYDILRQVSTLFNGIRQVRQFTTFFDNGHVDGQQKRIVGQRRGGSGT